MTAQLTDAELQFLKDEVVRENARVHEKQKQDAERKEAKITSDVDKIKNRQKVEAEQKARYKKMDEKSEAPIPEKERQVKPFKPMKEIGKGGGKEIAKRAVQRLKDKAVELANAPQPQRDDNPEPQPRRRITRC